MHLLLLLHTSLPGSVELKFFPVHSNIFRRKGNKCLYPRRMSKTGVRVLSRQVEDGSSDPLRKRWEVNPSIPSVWLSILTAPQDPGRLEEKNQKHLPTGRESQIDTAFELGSIRI